MCKYIYNIYNNNNDNKGIKEEENNREKKKKKKEEKRINKEGEKKGSNDYEQRDIYVCVQQ